ncbi:MAG: DUF4079 domain-containing protein [Cyanobium sp. M30B3]|nr:MAG: DUF4079 domain-containing protein [Cyanobium sp. M30B3]
MPQALSFVHPLLMWVLLGLMLYSGYLGFKASQIRQVDAAERKEMIPLRYGQRHAALGRWIVALSLLVLATAALGPALQKGQDWARGLHVGLNGLIVLLFGWQAITGIAIVNKLLSA